MKTIQVQFRKYKGEIIAVFPYEIVGKDTVVMYAHVGQHESIMWNINAYSKAAKPNDYADLLKELQSVGYDNLDVIISRSHSKYLEAYYKLY